MMTKLEAIAHYKASVLPDAPKRMRSILLENSVIYDSPVRLQMSAGGLCFPVHWNESMAFLPTAWSFCAHGEDFVFILIGVISDLDQQRLMWALNQLSVNQFWCDSTANERFQVFRERFLKKW